MNVMTEIIRAKRIALGLTQAEFASRVGVTGTTISSFENGREVSQPIYSMMHVVLRKAEESLDPIDRDIYNIRWRAETLDVVGGKERQAQVARIVKSCGFLLEKLTD